MARHIIPFSVSLEQTLELRRDQTGNPSLHDRWPNKPDTPPSLPGQPGISLTRDAVVPYLQAELLTPDLDAYGSHLWLVATQSSAHIGALHDQVACGRRIVLVENPELHLVWHADRVFVKPLPRYLTSLPFWECFLLPDGATRQGDDTQALAAAALGFVRSYRYLVRHESDFELAQKHGLVPSEVKWPDFVAFITGFRYVADGDVSARYQFGDLRLSRLNLWAWLFVGRWNFRDVTWSYDAYFTRFYGPILFTFGIFSVVLNAMQVVLAGSATGITPNSWQSLEAVCQWFAVATLLCTVAVSFSLLVALLALVSNETIYAIRARLRGHGLSRLDMEGTSSKS